MSFSKNFKTYKKFIDLISKGSKRKDVQTNYESTLSSKGAKVFSKIERIFKNNGNHFYN